jgi:hypothetical protein
MKMNFSATKATHAFLASKARREIGEFLDKIPGPNILFCIKNSKYLTDYIPLEKRLGYKQTTLPYSDIIEGLVIEEVYRWIPKNYLVFIESAPGGKEWLLRELEHIKNFLLSA